MKGHPVGTAELFDHFLNCNLKTYKQFTKKSFVTVLNQLCNNHNPKLVKVQKASRTEGVKENVYDVIK